ncbi:sphingosine-1-phosphate lyase [Acrasis kona]|uniref:sphinganine-1-phosphate aldolase n=1 Tax=Acrasis kona TaxID=1008807 RepID=A0AAW2ZIT4_9EUKA
MQHTNTHSQIPYLDKVNEKLGQYQPSTILLGTAGALISAYAVERFVQASLEHPGGAAGVVFGNLIKVIKAVPGARTLLENQRKDMIKKMKSSKKKLNQEVNLSIPTEGMSDESLVSMMENIKSQEVHKYNNHKLSGTIYIPDDQHCRTMAQAYELFMNTNPLHSDTFLSTQKFESEVIRMTASLFHGNYNPEDDSVDHVVGCLTSGGTESILMAMKAFRDKARFEKPHITKPEIIAPKTVHAAFEKACQYLGMTLVHVDVDPSTFVVKSEDVRKRINKNTIGLVGSAPNFSQGTIDPISELSELAIKYNLSLHVDSCLGGFYLPFAKLLNPNVPDFDFRLKGVTTISADTHKYGLAPKGSSVLLFDSKYTRKFMYFISPNWMGGMYASPTMPGSRPGALIATCWAAMMRTGKQGYMEQAELIMTTCDDMIKGIREQIPELRILGNPVGPVVSFDACNGIDIYQIGDAMHAAGWELSTLQNPKSLHICVTAQHKGMANELIKDLKKSVYDVVNHQEKFVHGMAPVYGMAVSMPDKAVVGDLISDVIDLMLDIN